MLSGVSGGPAALFLRRTLIGAHEKTIPTEAFTDRSCRNLFHSNIPGQNYSTKNKIKLMEQLQRVAGAKVVATADGGAPYSLDEQRFCFVFFVVVFGVFFAWSRSATQA